MNLHIIKKLKVTYVLKKSKFVNEISKYTVKITAVYLHIATNTLGHHTCWQEFGRSVTSWAFCIQTTVQNWKQKVTFYILQWSLPMQHITSK